MGERSGVNFDRWRALHALPYNWLPHVLARQLDAGRRSLRPAVALLAALHCPCPLLGMDLIALNPCSGGWHANFAGWRFIGQCLQLVGADTFKMTGMNSGCALAGLAAPTCLSIAAWFGLVAPPAHWGSVLTMYPKNDSTPQ